MTGLSFFDFVVFGAQQKTKIQKRRADLRKINCDAEWRISGVAGGVDDGDEGASGGGEFGFASIAESGGMDEFAANADGEGSCGEIFGGIFVVHAAGGN
jgi:hypothetical protein